MHATDSQTHKFVRLFVLARNHPVNAPVSSRVVADVVQLLDDRAIVCMRALGTISVFNSLAAIEMQHPGCAVVPVQWPAIEDALALYRANDELLSSARDALKAHIAQRDALKDAYDALDSVWQTCSHEHWPLVGQAMDTIRRSLTKHE